MLHPALFILSSLNDIGMFEKRLRSFVSMETMALEIYHFPKNAPGKHSIIDSLPEEQRGLAP